jgi:hypothetical protein
MLGLSVRFGVVPQRVVRRVATLLQPLFVPAVVVTAIVAVAVLDGWLLLAHGIGDVVPELLSDPGLLLVVVGVTLAGGAFTSWAMPPRPSTGGRSPAGSGLASTCCGRSSTTI